VRLERIEGAWTALVTPFTTTGGVHWQELERLASFQVQQGITGLVPTGTTGESPTLTWEEHDRVIETAIRLKGQRAKVMAGTGSNSTDEALRGSRHAVEAGADALLLVDCYYNGPSSLELRREYHAVIARECPEALIVPYVIPGRSGTALAPEDLAVLAEELPNARAVKEATGDLERMARTRQLVGDDFSIMSGDDNITPTIMTDERIRANGVVSVVSNVVPAAVEGMTRAARRRPRAALRNRNRLRREHATGRQPRGQGPRQVPQPAPNEVPHAGARHDFQRLPTTARSPHHARGRDRPLGRENRLGPESRTPSAH